MLGFCSGSLVSLAPIIIILSKKTCMDGARHIASYLAFQGKQIHEPDRKIRRSQYMHHRQEMYGARPNLSHAAFYMHRSYVRCGGADDIEHGVVTRAQSLVAVSCTGQVRVVVDPYDVANFHSEDAVRILGYVIGRNRNIELVAECIIVTSDQMIVIWDQHTRELLLFWKGDFDCFFAKAHGYLVFLPDRGHHLHLWSRTTGMIVRDTTSRVIDVGELLHCWYTIDVDEILRIWSGTACMTCMQLPRRRSFSLRSVYVVNNRIGLSIGKELYLWE